MAETAPAPLLTVVIPVFDEARTVAAAVERVFAQPYAAQVVAVDDGSTDGSGRILDEIAARRGALDVIHQERNRGKGAALRAGFARANGDFVLVQDADLEYDPRDYRALLEPLLDGRADVVYGSRFLGGPHRVLNYHHFIANRMLTALSNALTNLNLTDMEVGYKAFRREVLDSLDLREDGFGFEPEFTARVAAGGWKIYEVPISYSGRGYDEGKKIGWKDGLAALRVIATANLRARFAGGGAPGRGARPSRRTT